MGCEVFVADLVKGQMREFDGKTIRSIPKKTASSGKIARILEHFQKSKTLLALTKNLKFDIIYTRYLFFTPNFAKFLGVNKTVMEINSDDKKESKFRGKIWYYYNLLTRNLIYKKVSGFVCVSSELASEFKSYNRPLCVMANGVSVAKYPLKTTQNSRPRLIFIGSSGQSWHGVDKIISMANALREYDFYMIGIDGDDTQNLKFLGKMSDEKASQIICGCDIGICTLSLYKKGMSEASPLKTRQYLACGLPIIYAYDDSDLSGDESFALKLANSPNNVDLETIKEFVNRVFGDIKINDEVRKFALNHLDSEKKERDRVEFMKRLV